MAVCAFSSISFGLRRNINVQCQYIGQLSLSRIVNTTVAVKVVNLDSTQFIGLEEALTA